MCGEIDGWMTKEEEKNKVKEGKLNVFQPLWFQDERPKNPLAGDAQSTWLWINQAASPHKYYKYSRIQANLGFQTT